jgi:hypothetical protein
METSSGQIRIGSDGYFRMGRGGGTTKRNIALRAFAPCLVSPGLRELFPSFRRRGATKVPEIPLS